MWVGPITIDMYPDERAEEIYKWLEDYIGPYGVTIWPGWCEPGWYERGKNPRSFYFTEDKDCTMFALRWAS